jgi:hypothetical protein
LNIVFDSLTEGTYRLIQTLLQHKKYLFFFLNWIIIVKHRLHVHIRFRSVAGHLDGSLWPPVPGLTQKDCLTPKHCGENTTVRPQPLATGPGGAWKFCHFGLNHHLLHFLMTFHICVNMTV